MNNEQNIESDIENINEKQIVVDLTEVDASNITVNSEGWTSRVYIVNGGEMVFKFPRREEVKKEYVTEVDAYRLVQDIDTSITFPVIEWESPDMEYMVYKGVVGESFTEAVKGMSTEEKQYIGREIGAFLKKLHVKKLSSASRIDIADEIKYNKKDFYASTDVLIEITCTLLYLKVIQISLVSEV